MTTNLVDPNGHVAGDPLPVIYLATMSKSHNHDQEHIVGNGVDGAVVAYAHPDNQGDLAEVGMLAASGRRRVARLRLGYGDELPGRVSAVPGPQRDAARCDRSSLPAEIGLHLIPGDVGTFLCHRCVEGLGVFGILERLDQLLILFGADQHRCRPAVALEEHRFGVGHLHRLGKSFPSFADCHLCHWFAHLHFRPPETSVTGSLSAYAISDVKRADVS
jgi:hypothetical protein